MIRSKQHLIPFITEEEINEIIRKLSRSIERDYEGKSLTIICPLKGSVPFCSDLMRELKLKQEIDFVHLTSPRGQSVQILKDVSIDLTNKHVLIVEEIVDAGRTLNFLKNRIISSSPASVKIVALLDKPARRELLIKPDYIGRTIDDRFVFGYGMDHEEKGRNLKAIYSLAQ
jgi:hypoxanthine phosphoribosyltransferase